LFIIIVTRYYPAADTYRILREHTEPGARVVHKHWCHCSTVSQLQRCRLPLYVAVVAAAAAAAAVVLIRMRIADVR